jgi:hypothetical protein
MSEALWVKLAKAKTSKTRRIIKKKLPRFNEGAKKVLLLEGGKSSQTVGSTPSPPLSLTQCLARPRGRQRGARACEPCAAP